jgi:hypothetical protein
MRDHSGVFAQRYSFSSGLLDLLAPQFEQQLREFKAEDSFMELVRRAIQDRLTGRRPSVEEIAAALHLGHARYSVA